MSNWWEADSLAKANLDNTDEAGFAKNAAWILTGIPNGGHALEIGSGTGRTMRHVAKHFEYVTGVDVSQTIVDYAEDVLKDLPQCTVCKNDGYELPFRNESFDFVYSYVVFQHLHTPQIVEGYIKEAYRVLKKGGLCRIQTVKGEPVYSSDGNHGWLFKHEAEFASMFWICGFKSVETVMGVSHPQHIWVTAKKNV